MYVSSTIPLFLSVSLFSLSYSFLFSPFLSPSLILYHTHTSFYFIDLSLLLSILTCFIPFFFSASLFLSLNLSLPFLFYGLILFLPPLSLYIARYLLFFFTSCLLGVVNVALADWFQALLGLIKVIVL